MRTGLDGKPHSFEGGVAVGNVKASDADSEDLCVITVELKFLALEANKAIIQQALFESNEHLGVVFKPYYEQQLFGDYKDLIEDGTNNNNNDDDDDDEEDDD